MTEQGKEGYTETGQKADYLDQLKGGELSPEDFVLRQHNVITKQEPEDFFKSIGDTVSYQKFVSSVRYGDEGTAIYGQDKSFNVPVRRKSGEVEDNWEAIGLTEYENSRGEEVQGYLVVRHVYDDQNRLTGVLSKVVDIVDTENLLKKRKAEKQRLAVGSAAIDMVPREPVKTGKEIAIMEILPRFNDSDQKSLENFALYAARKRAMQLAGEGVESMFASGLMGKELKSMSPEAQFIAERFARLRYGNEKVAF